MKRKHDALRDADDAAHMASAQLSFAHSRDRKHLRGPDLLTEVKHLGPKGWGLISKQPAVKGSLVLEYTGDLLSRVEAQERIKEYEKDEIENLHILHVSTSTVIDATRNGNDARYMQLATDANCQPQKWVLNGQQRALIVAVRDIVAGEELTFESYRQCCLGAHVRCLCGPVACHSTTGTPVLQSISETERMADAVLKCIQETDFEAQEEVHGDEHAAARAPVSTPPRSKQVSTCGLSPGAFASPPPATREDINALGLDSPDSFLDDLHRSAVRPAFSLQAITSRCRSIIGQLADPAPALPPAATAAAAASAQHPAGAQHQQHDAQLSMARGADSGAVLASAAEGVKLDSRRLLTEAAQQQLAQSSLSCFASDQPAEAKLPTAGPARQAKQQLQRFLEHYKHVEVGGCVVAQTSQPPTSVKPYKQMKALKSILGPRLQSASAASFDLVALVKEADWPEHLWASAGQVVSQVVAPQDASPPQGTTSLVLQPLAAVTHVPSLSIAASAGNTVRSGVHQPGSMQPPAAVNMACALTGALPSPSLSGTTVTEQQQSAGTPAVPLIDAVLGGQGPPSSPEGMTSCLVSLGLTSAQIQACLENAQRLDHLAPE